ncbi:MAG: hypothetical protein ABL931_07245 [Usitatibacteraceae bacterium]
MAQTSPAPSTLDAAKAPLMVPFAALDSPAQIAFRKLAPAAAQTGAESGQAPIRVAAAEKIHPDLITRLEEIRVYGRNEPEDFVGPKKSPLMQFRARLEGEVTLSPAKKAQLALCFIGLCSIYGPDGIPVGDSPERRAEARIVESTLSRQVRGTLQ